MQRRAALLAAIALVGAAACAGSSVPPIAAPSGTLPDGLYRVTARSPSRFDAEAAAGRARRLYDPRASDPASQDSAVYVELDSSDYVPLQLARAPTTLPQPDGRIGLEIALDKAHVARLERLTKNNAGGLLAIVMDGEVATMHKQRAVISDGRMKITRCSDRACEKILTRLSER
jgi:hypothetical protein